MTSLSSNAYRLSVIAAGVAGFLGVGIAAASAQQQQPPQGWFKACAKQEDVDICNVQNIITANNGQLLTSVGLIEIKGKVNRKVFQVSVPPGRIIGAGIGMQIDTGKTQKLDYVVCFPDHCVAEVPLTDQLVGSFKKGQALTLTSVNFQGQQNPIKIALQGFSGAYDGPPLQQPDLEDRQKKVQDFVAKNNQDFAKKLKEEQDKAKTAN